MAGLGATIPLAASGRCDEGGRVAISGLDFYSSFEAAEKVWRSFEPNALSTPYQRYDWLEAWYRHIGGQSKLEPLVVVARDDLGRVSLLWPLVVRTVGTARIAMWPGGKFSNYNLGLYAPDLVPAIDEECLHRVMRDLSRDADIDGLALRNQPQHWRGIENPLLQLPHYPSPSDAFSLPLQSDYPSLLTELRSTSSRKKLRKSERRIVREYGKCELRRAEDTDCIDRILNVFMRQKATRLREMSVPNPFHLSGVMPFFRELAARGLKSNEPLLDLFWLDTNGPVAAIWAGTAGGGRMCGIFNSFESRDLWHHRPGELMLGKVIEDCCDRRFMEFDLGVGEAQYKTSWCTQTDRLFDSFLPLTARGWVHTSLASSCFRLKRAAKHSRFLRNLRNWIC